MCITCEFMTGHLFLLNCSNHSLTIHLSFEMLKYLDIYPLAYSFLLICLYSHILYFLHWLRCLKFLAFDSYWMYLAGLKPATADFSGKFKYCIISIAACFSFHVRLWSSSSNCFSHYWKFNRILNGCFNFFRHLEHFVDLRQYLGLNSDSRAAPQSEESHFN